MSSIAWDRLLVFFLPRFKNTRAEVHREPPILYVYSDNNWRLQLSRHEGTLGVMHTFAFYNPIDVSLLTFEKKGEKGCNIGLGIIRAKNIQRCQRTLRKSHLVSFKVILDERSDGISPQQTNKASRWKFCWFWIFLWLSNRALTISLYEYSWMKFISLHIWTV